MARVLSVHRYYYPDAPPYAVMLRRIVQRWAKDGHEVEVLAGQPSYRESRKERLPRVQMDGLVRVRRLRLPAETGRSPLLRAANAARLAAAVFVRVASGRYDIVTVSTVPPVVLGAAAAWASRIGRARLIYHCMDLHPEIGRLSGEFSNPRLFDALMRTDVATMRAARPVVVLSEDMADAVRGRPNSLDIDVAVRNNFALPSDDSDGSAGTKAEDAHTAAQQLWRSLALPDGAFTVLFAGNIGRFQGLDDAIAALAEVHSQRQVHLVLMGDGHEAANLKALASDLGIEQRVHFLGLQSVAVARAVMRLANAGLVSLRPDVIRFAYPSKTGTYAAESLVLVLVIEPDSDLAADVVARGAGVVAEPGNPADLAAVLSKLAAESADQLEAMAAASAAWAAAEFDEESALDWWSELVRI